MVCKTLNNGDKKTLSSCVISRRLFAAAGSRNFRASRRPIPPTWRMHPGRLSSSRHIEVEHASFETFGVSNANTLSSDGLVSLFTGRGFDCALPWRLELRQVETTHIFHLSQCDKCLQHHLRQTQNKPDQHPTHSNSN